MCLRFVILLVFLLAEQVLASVSTTASSAPAVAETTVFAGVSENEKGIVSRPASFDEGSWYIDATNGDDNLGDGSREKPFKSIRKILSINKLSTNYLRSGDTLYLAEGNYNEDSI